MDIGKVREGWVRGEEFRYEDGMEPKVYGRQGGGMGRTIKEVGGGVVMEVTEGTGRGGILDRINFVEVGF